MPPNFTEELRRVYDRYGHSVLKNGDISMTISLSHFLLGESHKGYSFSGDPMEIFEKFFGTVNPFHISLDSNGQ